MPASLPVAVTIGATVGVVVSLGLCLGCLPSDPHPDRQTVLFAGILWFVMVGGVWLIQALVPCRGDRR